MEQKIVLVLDDIRSAQNVGAIMRTAVAFNSHMIYCCGLTPYLKQPNDTRLPHEIYSTLAKIIKTSLGAERKIKCHHRQDINDLLGELKAENYDILAVENDPQALDLTKVKPGNRIALVLGNEIRGVNDKVLKNCDKIISINSSIGTSSINVSSAAAIALFWLDNFAKKS